VKVETKKRILFSMGVAVALWPALHHLAVRRYELSPWMYFGFSMYTRPRPIVEVVDVRIGFGRGPLRTVDGRMLGPNAEEKAKRIGHLTGTIALSRLAHGTLGRPEAPMAELFGLFPKAGRISVQVKIREMDDQATMSTRLVDYDCTRAADEDVACTLRAG
jgi:hypothetical protein